MTALGIPQYDVPERKHKLAIFDGSYLVDIPSYIRSWNATRVVLVASKSLYANTKYVQQLEDVLGSAIVAKKIGVGAHSPYADVRAIAHLIQDQEADCIVCIGSSSYTDATKVAAKLAATLEPGFTDGGMEDVIVQSKGAGMLKESTVKVILVPTSLSAAEWNGTGSCTNSFGKKQHFHSGNMKVGAADLVLCDPLLASTAPKSLWLASGVRCIDHCVETICNQHCTEQSEQDALTGLHAMLTGLAAYSQGAQSDQAEMLRGVSAAQKASRLAIESIIIHGNTGGPSHAIGHQLGSVAGVGHGVTTCILLGPTLRYTVASDETVFARAKLSQPKILKVFESALGWQEDNASDALVKFFKQLGLPTRLSEVGVTDEARIDKIAEATLTDIWGGGEPQITKKEEVRKILNMAL